MSSVTNEDLCLHWNDFESSISTAIRDIREKEDFFDCTLSCGSGQVQAHKIILSSCSPFFRSILQQNPHEHPLLYLKGVELSDLQAVLNFMYEGEVRVAREELHSFLETAKEFQIKGLTQDNAEQNKRQCNMELLTREESNNDEVLKKETAATVNEELLHDEHQYADDEQLPQVKIEPVEGSFTHENPKQGRYEDQVMEYDWSEDLDNKQQEQEELYQESVLEIESHKEVLDMMIFKSGDQFQCSECGRSFVVKSQCRRHVKNVHSTQKELCPICQKYMKNKTTLKSHLRGTHGVYQN